ncbi:hypothetical protein GCM10028857_18840 [Salinarchaeum chitinilyticum]
MRSVDHSLLAIVLLLGLALATATAGAAADESSTPGGNVSNETIEALDVPSLDGPDTYAGNHTWLRLWSGDVDQSPSKPFGDGRFGFEASLAASTDVPFDRPLQAPAAWNAKNVGEHQDHSLQTSRYPQGTTVTDGEFLRDAYVEIYAIDPSTILHTDGALRRYVDESGTVSAVSDFRIPTSLEAQSGAVEHTVEAVSKTATTVSLSYDGQQLDTGQGAQTALAFEGVSDAGTLRVAAEIRARLEVETRQCDDWNVSSGTCEGSWSVSTSTQVDSVTVDAERSVERNDLGVSNRKRVDLHQGSNTATPDGPVPFPGESQAAVAGGVAIEPTGHWSSVDVGPNASVGSQLRFYSRSPDGWEQFVVAGPNGTSTTESTVRPLQLHAYPAPDGLDPSQAVDVEAVTGDAHDGPTLGPQIDLAVPAQYQHPDELAVSATVGSPQALSTITVRGIVPGRQRTISLPPPTQERAVALDLSVEAANATHDHVTATVREAATDDPISVGHLAIDGERYSIENGSVSTTLESPPRTIEATYHPPSWLDASRLYEPATESAKRSTPGLGVVDVVDFVLWTALALLPLALAVLGVDYMTDGRLLGFVSNDR